MSLRMRLGDCLVAEGDRKRADTIISKVESDSLLINETGDLVTLLEVQLLRRSFTFFLPHFVRMTFFVSNQS